LTAQNPCPRDTASYPLGYSRPVRRWGHVRAHLRAAGC